MIPISLLLFIIIIFSFLTTVPGVPILNRLCTVIIWKPPKDTAGVLTGYDFMMEGFEEIRYYEPESNFYITSDTERKSNALVRVSSDYIVALKRNILTLT